MGGSGGSPSRSLWRAAITLPTRATLLLGARSGRPLCGFFVGVCAKRRQTGQRHRHQHATTAQKLFTSESPTTPSLARLHADAGALCPLQVHPSLSPWRRSPRAWVRRRVRASARPPRRGGGSGSSSCSPWPSRLQCPTCCHCSHRPKSLRAAAAGAVVAAAAAAAARRRRRLQQLQAYIRPSLQPPHPHHLLPLLPPPPPPPRRAPLPPKSRPASTPTRIARLGREAASATITRRTCTASAGCHAAARPRR